MIGTSTPRTRWALVLVALAVPGLAAGCTSAGDRAGAAASPSGIVGDPPVGERQGRPTATAEPGPTPAGLARVDVVITYGGYEPGTGDVEVGGFAAVVEEDGRCVLTLERSGADDVRVEGAAVPDVATTACGLLAVPAAQLEPGRWEAHLDYRSGRSAGESDVMTVEVP